MPILSTELPALPFENQTGSYTDCVLLYLPNVDSWRCIVFNNADADAVVVADPGGYDVYGGYLELHGALRSYFTLEDGEWVIDGTTTTFYPIYTSLEDVPETYSHAGYPISSTIDLYQEDGEERVLMHLAHSDLKNGNLTIMDSVLAGSQLKTPIITTITSLLPVCLALIVGFIGIRKGIAFLSDKLRRA